MARVFAHPLLATECSEHDSGAERVAFAMARRCEVPLSAVFPLASNPEYEALAPQLAARAERDAALKVQGLREQALREGVTLEARIRRGPEAYLEIVDEARERAADLMVTRRRGRHGFMANLLLGDMVRNVIAHAPCSVLVAPRATGMWSRRVLAAVDPQAPDLRTVRTAATVAADCELPLSVICVNEAPSSARRQQAERALQAALAEARAAGAQADGAVRVGQPHRQIGDAARELGADLLVLGRHGSEDLARTWLGGVAQKVIGLADCPVLIAVQPDSSER